MTPEATSAPGGHRSADPQGPTLSADEALAVISDERNWWSPMALGLDEPLVVFALYSLFVLGRAVLGNGHGSVFWDAEATYCLVLTERGEQEWRSIKRP